MVTIQSSASRTPRGRWARRARRTPRSSSCRATGSSPRRAGSGTTGGPGVPRRRGSCSRRRAPSRHQGLRTDLPRRDVENGVVLRPARGRVARSQAAAVSPILFRRHWTKRPTWRERRADLDLLRRGVAVSPAPASTSPPRGSSCDAGCVVSAPLPCLSAPRLAPGRLFEGVGTFLGALAGTVSRPRPPGFGRP